jgi:sodium/hydrogen antiporter
MTWALATIAVLLIGFAAVSRRLEALNITAAMFFTSAGLLAGPILGLLDFSVGSEEVKLLAEITLTLVLFADASRISVRALRRDYTVPVRLLGLGLPLTIADGAVLGLAVLPGVSFVEALVLAIMLACTDAALGQAVVTDQRVPSRIRQGLNVESGLNDGLCVPLFFIAIALAEAEEGTASGHSPVQLVLEEIGYGLIGGIVAGVLGGLALRLATRHRAIEPYWMQILTAASALLAAGLALGLGGSIFIAAFTAGFVFGGAAPRPGRRGHLPGRRGRRAVQRGHLHRLRRRDPRPGAGRVDLAARALCGAEPDDRADAAGRGRDDRNRRPATDAGVLGWFGPRGLASIVFGVILLDDADLPHEHTLLLGVVVTVAISVFAHGLTARPLTNRYVGWYQSHPRDAAPPMETVPAAEHRWRTPRIGHPDNRGTP